MKLRVIGIMSMAVIMSCMLLFTGCAEKNKYKQISMSEARELIEAGTDALPDKDQKMLRYCWTGRRSVDSAELLAEAGYTDIIDIGGFIDWEGETEQ